MYDCLPVESFSGKITPNPRKTAMWKSNDSKIKPVERCIHSQDFIYNWTETLLTHNYFTFQRRVISLKVDIEESNLFDPLSFFLHLIVYDIMKKKRSVATELVSRASSVLPAFTDIFDEETFYIFFACLVVISFIVAFGVAWYFDVTIKDADELKSSNKRFKGRSTGDSSRIR
ncbi:unnamed protein product [Heterobilharzia americana]|nr:unnamed protein product [Heterobilharzia americana]